MAMMVNPGRFVTTLSWTTVRTRTLTSDSNTWGGYTMRQRIDAAGLTDFGATHIRVTLQAGNAEGLSVGQVYVGSNGGSGLNYSGSPVQLLFGGSAGIVIPAGETRVTDPAVFAFDGTGSIVVGIYVAAGAIDTFRAAGASNTQVGFKHTDPSSEAGTVTVSGYNTAGVSQDVIALIEGGVVI